MNLAVVAVRNLRRNPFRSWMTILGVAVGVLTFVLLTTVTTSLLYSEGTARLYATNRLSFTLPMPKKYAEQVPASVPGVEASTYTNNFDGKLPSDPSYQFLSIAAYVPTFFDVFNEIAVTPAERASWLEDRQGAIIGEMLAKKLGAKVGDRITLKGTRYRGDWVFNVRAIYTLNKQSWDRSTIFFHWDYLNEGIPQHQKDQIHWVAMRMPDSRLAEAASVIEQTFRDKEVPLRSFSHDAFGKQIGAMFSSVLNALGMMSFAILVILTMILGNTIATGVRERTRESGTLRAIGFSKGWIVLMTASEAIVFALIGGLLGLAISFPLVQEGIGKALTENANQAFPAFKIAKSTAIMAVLLPVVLGGLAGVFTAVRAARVNVVDALRHVE